MLKNKLKYLYLATGFIFGASYIVACGGGANGIADTVANAIDVLFNNSTSGLNAKNLQEAIDELNEKIEALQIGGVLPLKEADLVGTWNGETVTSKGNFQNVSLTLNSNGTYACTGQGEIPGGGFNVFLGLNSDGPVCQAPASWSVQNRSIILIYTYNGESKNVAYPVNYIDGSNLEILTGHDDGFFVTELGK